MKTLGRPVAYKLSLAATSLADITRRYWLEMHMNTIVAVS